MIGEMSVPSMGEMWKSFCPNFTHLFFLKVLAEGDGSWGLNPVFHNPHLKGPPSVLVVALNLTGRGALLNHVERKGEKQAWIPIGLAKLWREPSFNKANNGRLYRWIQIT